MKVLFVVGHWLFVFFNKQQTTKEQITNNKAFMPIIDALLVITLALLVGVLIRGSTKNRQQQLEESFNRQQLEDAFYQLLQEQGSCISLIQLTAAARVDVQQARQYLERQVQLFAAVPEVDADGDTFYRFPKLHKRSSVDKST
jgi:uncharacterized protein HemX